MSDKLRRRQEYAERQLARTTQHPRDRALERFELELSPSDVELITECIKLHVANNIARCNGVTMVTYEQETGFPPVRKVAVHFKRVWMPVVFNEAKGCVSTILPVDKLPRHYRNR